MRKHFVIFYCPGTFIAEISEREIESWNVEKALQMSEDITERYGAKPYGFKFITRERTDEELDSNITRHSGTYYINGVVETLNEIKARHNPNDRILISNMECNNWCKVVTMHTPYKWTQPFRDEDVVVMTSGRQAL